MNCPILHISYVNKDGVICETSCPGTALREAVPDKYCFCDGYRAAPWFPYFGFSCFETMEGVLEQMAEYDLTPAGRTDYAEIWVYPVTEKLWTHIQEWDLGGRKGDDGDDEVTPLYKILADGRADLNEEAIRKAFVKKMKDDAKDRARAERLFKKLTEGFFEEAVAQIVAIKNIQTQEELAALFNVSLQELRGIMERKSPCELGEVFPEHQEYSK